MCGLAGCFAPATSAAQRQAEVARMNACIVHRGPDASGVWAEETGRVALGHRRLSILDLSEAGAQPMRSASGRFVVAFNGEVYNHLDLRADIDGVEWRGHSDTETLAAGFEAWGIRATLERAVGMFALAIWDREHGELVLARDRLGIKPLYVGRLEGGGVAFASELEAVARHPAFRREIDREAVALLLRYGCIPAPHAVYEGARKLMPGSIVTYQAPHLDAGEEEVYWSGAAVAARGQASPFTGSPEAAVDALDGLLRDAVGARMLADVPLGAFLSGGVDSSTVVALMQAQSSRPVKTFTIGSHDAQYDEGEDAAAVAKHLGTDHTSLVVSPEDALAALPALAASQDEPFADPSMLPTFLVSQLARRNVTVALSGDGGDELFAGYNRHQWTERVWRAIRPAPRWVRGAVSRGIEAVSPEAWNDLFERFAPVLPPSLRLRIPGYKLHKLAGVLSASSPLDVFERSSAQWQDAARLVRGADGLAPAHPSELAGLPDIASQTMLVDLLRYLPDVILTKVDRASMAVSLEARVPLLDHRVVEHAWSLPLGLKLRDGTTKWALRQVLYRYVPQPLIDRPKSGFDLPLYDWLRGPLRGWAEALLDEKRLREEGIFEPEPIREAWAQHLAGTHSLEYPLWTVLMFQSWLDGRHTPAIEAERAQE
ncbi:asparagine synthase (glutamine-hydrolyzing) [Rubricoccus marinus]|uniref:asparagine synthase (glutamine-hydrolyzing) n=1 Tax=Rubricoccus marinus TaxID=716817 RepID=A0A259U0P7_9BACT|nr:asparagine synthase (glutamine-hydrolyzing) [Rubricoccus marinus]OZC03417.1 asparagine synthase (glutamine-hydrolyzing) [Rubricoccus marinus]